MSIQSIVDFSQATTEPERYRPDPAKVLRGDPNKWCTTTSTALWPIECRRLGKVLSANGW